MKRTHAVILTALMGAAAVCMYATARRAMGPAAHANERATTRAQRWSAGSDHVYDLTWSGASLVHLPGAPHPMDVDVRLEATLLVRAIGARDGVSELVVSMPEIRTYDVRMQGKPMFDDATAPAEKSAIVGQAALVRMDERGRIVSVAFDPTTPPRVRQLLERVVQAVRVSLPPDGAVTTWEAEETTPTGTCKVRYRSDDARTLLRERVAYTHVTAVPAAPGELDDAPQHVGGGATIVLDTAGVLVSMRDTEQVTIDTGDLPYRSSSELELTRRAITPNDARPSDAARFTATAAPLAIDEQKRDESLVADTTTASIQATVLDYARSPDLKRGFIVRASAYGRLHPESTRALVALFQSTRSNASRTLVMDLLSATGDATAQEAMATLIGSSEARADTEAFGHFVQRFMLVRKPARATAAVVRDVYDEAKAQKNVERARASAVPLGALARKLHAVGDGLGDDIHATLLADLAAATDEDDQIALLKGLGNGAFVGDDAVMAPYARSTGAHVRDQVAFSLRNIDSDVTRTTLFELAQDRMVSVAVTAIRALRMQSLSGDDWARLRELVAFDKTPHAADGAIVSLLGTAASNPEDEAHPILVAILARTPANSDLHDEIEGLLAQERELENDHPIPALAVSQETR